MNVVLAWFSDGPDPDAMARARARFDVAVASVVPDTYVRHDVGGDDWGVIVLHIGDQGAYRWPVVAQDGGVTAVSLGIPVGLDIGPGPVGLARKLLDGEDVHRQVVPPFGLIVLDSSRRIVIQQDWLGMCRLFTGHSDGVTAFCSRPGLLAQFLDGSVRPDHEGWTSYAVCGHFGGELSPVRGTRMLRPGERVTGRWRDGGGWHLTSGTRYAVDDVVTARMDLRGRAPGEALDLAAQAFTATASSIDELYESEIALGLSGGKDSRLIAASFVSAGRLPRFVTNEDTAAEGETARRLMEILREKPGLDPAHQLVRAGAPSNVLGVGLRERTMRLQRRYDYQFPSTYVVRPAGDARLPAAVRPVSITGAGGELATGYWYPQGLADDAVDRSAADQAALSKLLSAVPAFAAAESAMAQERARILDLLDHAIALGLRGLELMDYLYLVERLRRWCTSAYHVGMVTPFLSPSVVSASFALSPTQKRLRLLHTGLLERLLPEWAEVPYVSVGTGPSTATRVWEGDGARVLRDLRASAHGEVVQLLRSEVVDAALAECSGRKGPLRHQKTLQQFAWLALAGQTLEPELTGSGSAGYGSAAQGSTPTSRVRSETPQPRTRVSIQRIRRFIRRTPSRLRSWPTRRSR